MLKHANTSQNNKTIEPIFYYLIKGWLDLLSISQIYISISIIIIVSVLYKPTNLILDIVLKSLSSITK